MPKYALSVLFTFIFISLNGQISQYQFSVQSKPYAALEGGTNLTADFTEDDWEENSMTFSPSEFIYFQFDQNVFCPLMELSFNGIVDANCFETSFTEFYQVLFAAQSTILDYRFSNGMDSTDTEIWYKFEDGQSYIEFRNLTFYISELSEISPDALFCFTYIFDHATGSFQYHYGPSTYNPAVHDLLNDSEYLIGTAYFKETEDMNSGYAAILLSGNPSNPEVNIFENGNEPIGDYFTDAIPVEGTLYSFTLNPNNTNNLDTKLTDYSVVPNPGNNEAIINNDILAINAELSIWNTNGQLMHQSVVNNKANIDTSTFPAGMYFFQVTTEKGTQTIKWMKR